MTLLASWRLFPVNKGKTIKIIRETAVYQKASGKKQTLVKRNTGSVVIS